MDHGAPSGVPAVFVTRGSRGESVHAVAACVADAGGRLALALGDIETPVYLRSAAKPFIAAEVVASGAVARFGFSSRELAVIAASHNAEPFHVAAVRSILSKIGLDESALRCGVHAPLYEPAARALAASGHVPGAIHNNCSGKHAGILAECVHLGLDTAGYLAAGHPVQQRILAFCARVLEEPLQTLPIAVDGCGIPVFATSLRRAARAFARLGALEKLAVDDARALGAVRDAMAAEPAFVAGTGRFDSALIGATEGRVVGKGGAEGVHGDALGREGLGLVVKVIDGNRRATPPAVLALLDKIGALEPAELAALSAFARPDVRNVAGDVVGAIAARVPDTKVYGSAS